MLTKQRSAILFKKTEKFNNLKPLFDNKKLLIENKIDNENAINLFQKKLKKMASIRNTTSKNSNLETNETEQINVISRPQITFIGLLDELNKIEAAKRKKEKLKLLKNSKSVGSMVKEPIIKFNLTTNYNEKKEHKKFIKRNNFSHNLESKLRMKNFINHESVSEFIIKTNNIAKEKYEIELKKERLANLIDIKENNLNAVKTRIKSIKETKELFENKFLDNFNDYIKHLNNLIKNEQKELMEIEERKKNVKNDLYFLENKIYEKQRELTHLHNWFLFFIEVKEKKRNTNFTIDYMERIKKKPIFNTPEDFIESINFLSKNNLRLLHSYNNNRDKIYKLELYRDSWYKDNLKLNEFMIKEFANKEKLYRELEKNNILLNNEKTYYQSLMNKSRKNWLVNLNCKISQKIMFLHQNTIEQNKKLHYINILNEEKKLSNIEMLYNIEKFVDEILSRINKLNNGKNGELVKNALIKLRINKAHNEKIELERKRIEEINRRNIEKANKVFFIPHRKIDKYYYHNVKNRLSRNKSKENIKNKSSLKINSISKTFKTSKSLYEIRNFEQKIINEILY